MDIRLRHHGRIAQLNRGALQGEEGHPTRYMIPELKEECQVNRDFVCDKEFMRLFSDKCLLEVLGHSQVCTLRCEWREYAARRSE